MRPRICWNAIGIMLATGIWVSAPSAAADPTVWVARSGGSTVYLVGTIHLLPPGVTWQSATIERALTESDELWLEAPLPTSSADAETKRLVAAVTTLGIEPAGQTLSSKLTAAEWKQLQEMTAAAHVQPAMLDRLQPWLAWAVAAVGVEQGVGWSGDLGADATLEREARGAGKPVKGFETGEQQLAIVAAMPPNTQLALLRSSLKDGGRRGKLEIERIARAWAAGEDAVLVKQEVDPMRTTAPDLYASFLVARNRAWAPQIEDMLKRPGTRLVAVGDLHLLGPDGVPALLKADGVTIERTH